MASRSSNVIVGLGGFAVAVDAGSGAEIWRTKLKGRSFVTVWHTGDRVYAGASGELFCLDAGTGSILWRNPLRGLGLGIVSFPGGGDTVRAAAEAARRAQAT